MGLFASLGLKPPKKAADTAGADTAALEGLQAELKAAMRDTIAYANQLKQPAAKAELAATLKAADSDSKKAQALPVAAQVQALKDTLVKLKSAADAASARSAAAAPDAARNATEAL